MNQQYWDDLIAEGRALTLLAEGAARDIRVAIHPEDRANIRKLAEVYRLSVRDTRYRDPNRSEHRLQDAIDAYRWIHPHASVRIGPQGKPRPQ